MGSGAESSGCEGGVGLWGDLEVELLGEDPADRFGPSQVTVFVDESGDHLWGRSNSALPK